MNNDTNSEAFELGYEQGHGVALDAVLALLVGQDVVDRRLVKQVSALWRKAQVRVPLGSVEAAERMEEEPQRRLERRA